MTNRLVEAHYLANADNPADESIHFWLTESFDLSFLEKLVARFPEQSKRLESERTVLRALLDHRPEEARSLLQQERRLIEIEDETYWAPLIRELHELRRSAARGGETLGF